jgi:hypothetical protein
METPTRQRKCSTFCQRGGKSYETIILKENIELYFKIGCKMVGHMHISQI